MAATHVGPYTVEDYYALPEDGQRYELLDGSLIVSPWPRAMHQRVLGELSAKLRGACPVALEAIQVAIRIRDSVLVPDLVVAHRAAVDRAGRDLEPAEIELVVEIVSPSNARMDRVLKPTVYAEAGIPAFWRIELEGDGGPEIHAYELAGAVYREVARVPSGQLFTATGPIAAEFDPIELTRPAPPGPGNASRRA
ncbi:MAG: Uma2 family endonuclease [Sporichthyaceae bacterium]|nr:Uma2 family endonuclease [Sporichthyaceae bacterium]